jgi:hypothetical protein
MPNSLPIDERVLIPESRDIKRRKGSALAHSVHRNDGLVIIPEPMDDVSHLVLLPASIKVLTRARQEYWRLHYRASLRNTRPMQNSWREDAEQRALLQEISRERLDRSHHRCLEFASWEESQSFIPDLGRNRCDLTIKR